MTDLGISLITSQSGIPSQDQLRAEIDKLIDDHELSYLDAFFKSTGEFAITPRLVLAATEYADELWRDFQSAVLSPVIRLVGHTWTAETRKAIDHLSSQSPQLLSVHAKNLLIAAIMIIIAGKIKRRSQTED
jgi:hypothetical protein